MSLKLLIAAGGAAADAEELPPGVRSLLDAASEILVISPPLPGRLDWLSSATDKAREQADERLASVLGQLEELGAGEARGAVSDDDPLFAFEEAIGGFEPDHLLVALRSAEHAGWQERGLLDSLVERFGIPLTVFRV